MIIALLLAAILVTLLGAWPLILVAGVVYVVFLIIVSIKDHWHESGK